MGYIASKRERMCIIRRFDTNGDAKIDIDEFIEGVTP